MPFTRRRALQTGGLLTLTGLSGCLFGGNCTHRASFELTPATDEAVAGRFSTPAARLGPLGQDQLRTAVDEGSATYRACDDLFADGVYALNGSYYDVTTTAGEQADATGYEVEFDISAPGTGTSPPSDRTIAFEELPDADQHALLYGFLNDVSRKVGGAEKASMWQVSGSTRICYHSAEARNSSVLVPDPEYEFVEYEDVRIELSVGESTDETSTAFEVRADSVADSQSAFADYAAEHLMPARVRLDGDALSEEQRSILQEAVVHPDEEYPEGYSACVDDPDDAFVDLVDRVFDPGEDGLKHLEATDPRPVVWGGETYLATYVVAVA